MITIDQDQLFLYDRELLENTWLHIKLSLANIKYQNAGGVLTKQLVNIIWFLRDTSMKVLVSLFLLQLLPVLLNLMRCLLCIIKAFLPNVLKVLLKSFSHCSSPSLHIWWPRWSVRENFGYNDKSQTFICLLVVALFPHKAKLLTNLRAVKAEPTAVCLASVSGQRTEVYSQYTCTGTLKKLLAGSSHC